MSTQTITKKRKSADGNVSAAKKAKVAKSADKPAPVKSALKRAPADEGAAMEVKTKKAKAAKPVIEAHEVKKSKPAAKAAKPAKKAEKKEKIIIENNDNDDEDADEETGPTLTPDQTASLLAGFSSESEDEGQEEDEGIPVSKLPKAPTTGDIQDRIASATKAAKKSGGEADDPERTPGVVYIGRVPRGFHEPQMRAYFSQFGTITHLKLARNRKTGKSKHFGFLEFSSSVVADIVAKTMDKYLLFNHILQVRRVPSEQMAAYGDGFWKGEGRRGWNVRPNNKLERSSLRRGKTREEWEKNVERETRKRSAKADALREIGYEFEMPAVKSVGEVPVKVKLVEDVAPAADAVGGAAPVEDVVLVEQTVGEDNDGNVVVEEKKKTKTKKRPAEGKPKVKEARKVVKKAKA